ncbi:MAG: Crp/Fnr family transcriptional regulator [Eubacteriaceae bacterium]|nr:Crp/Fnr family transcriptional regulator [Eubacteriaceae bacterium]
MDYSRIYPFWDKLSDDEREDIVHSCYTENYPKGGLMHRSEENCKGLITVLSGQLRTYILSEEGREITLFRVHRGDVCVLSASCLMDAIDFDVLIESTEETEVLVLPSICLNSIMKNNPYVELYLYKAAAEKFSDVMWTMQQILFLKVDQRIAGFLWDEMTQRRTTTLQLTHDEIARNIGSAREVVSKVLKYLSENQVVEVKRGKIIILDKEKMKKYM